jgi:hypothetical protein
MARDFDDPKYKKWRGTVFKRDRWKCRMPGCKGGDKRLNAHHIKRWGSAPTLRYLLSNGITLCRTCHEQIRGKEEEFEATFSRIVNLAKTNASLKLLMMRYGKPKED